MALEIKRTVDGRWDDDGSRVLDIHTNAGVINCRMHTAQGAETGIVWVFGSAGGLDGPAGGLFVRLARILQPQGWTSLRLDYRAPGHLMSCVLDALAGMHVLEQMGIQRIVLVGHSFGGAVMISAGAASAATSGVVAMSSQNAGTGAVDKLSPKPLLLMHGTEDEVVPPSSSQEIYKKAVEPKKLLLYPGCKHGLDECREQVDADLLDWIRNVAALS
jgi:esterase/lipase